MKNQSLIKKQLQSAFPFVCYGDRFALCGQPQAEDLKEFKKEFWTDIINLRVLEELDNLDFEMSEVCETLGLNYNHIPVIVKGDIDKESLQKIHVLLSSSDKEKRFVLHCASGARSVIALIAHFILSDSHKVDEIPALAEKLGLLQPKMLIRLFQVMDLDLSDIGYIND